MKFRFENVLVAGRRVSGEGSGRDEAEALRHFAAAVAREAGADVATAIAQARDDKLKKVFVQAQPLGVGQPLLGHRSNMLMIDDYTDWPAMCQKERAPQPAQA